MVPDTKLSVAKPVVTQAMRRLLAVVFVLMAILVIDSVYLSAVSFTQWVSDSLLEGSFYQLMFLLHLILGTIVIVPTLVFIGLHLRRAYSKPNRLAVRIGISLFIAVLVLFITGIGLTRGLPLFELKHEISRDLVYWLHVLAPVVAVWLFILHRLAGPRIRWRTGIYVATTSLVVAMVGLIFIQIDFEEEVLAADFSPSLSRTSHGGYIDPDQLMSNDYCLSCHTDIHESWSVSAHKFASFNNPAYAFSVNNTREKVLARDGNLDASRFCASCHDPVPLFSGLFDDPGIDFETHLTGQAGITCVSCHAIQEVNGVKGNGQYTIGIPEAYPFTQSDSSVLSWVNGMLIKGRPQLHKVSYMKPFHQTAEFCSTCHKVHIPEDLNHYKWLRGQNHYDSFLISGVSGHGLSSFYYPQMAESNCNGCHMPLVESEDFGSVFDPEFNRFAIHSHQFPAANTALQILKDLPAQTNQAHLELLEDSLRVDIFAVFEGDDITGRMTAPLKPQLPQLAPGKSYVFAIVIRNLKVGHRFTEGTIDSNEVWLEVKAEDHSGVTVASSGEMDKESKAVKDSHFVNGYVIDRQGNRIDRRNAEDIFVKLYDHQIGPGSADVAFYKLEVPVEIRSDEIVLRTRLRYRKFDQQYLELFTRSPGIQNTLPVVDIADDSLRLPLNTENLENLPSSIPTWERWNDFGIGMLLKPKLTGLRHAESAFLQVESMDRPEGSLNLARLYIKEGRLEEAIEALDRAGSEGAYPWSVAWFGGQVDMQLGNFREALVKFDQLLHTEFEEARRRGFDFSKDYNLTNEIGLAHFELSKIASSDEQSQQHLKEAELSYLGSLKEDPENVTAHYGLVQVYAALGESELSTHHQTLHSTYRVDDNAKDRAIGLARTKSAFANKASEAIVIWDLKSDLD